MIPIEMWAKVAKASWKAGLWVICCLPCYLYSHRQTVAYLLISLSIAKQVVLFLVWRGNLMLKEGTVGCESKGRGLSLD
jgi:hypothetical protein